MCSICLDKNMVHNKKYQENGKDKKFQLMELLGNRCEMCLADVWEGNWVMFCFHHKIPANKSFNLSVGRADTKPLSKEQIAEAMKCSLLCHRCHFELHFNIEENKVRTQNAELQRNRNLKLKQECVDYLGGYCKYCGYNKCLRALELHHIVPANKHFGVSKAIASNKSFEDLKPELDKCELVCSNCHSLLENGLLDPK